MDKFKAFVVSVFEWFNGKKTYITAIAGLVGSVVAWAQGAISTLQLIQAVWACLVAIFMRNSISK